MITLQLDGLEDLLRQVVRDELAAARDSWLTSADAAEYLSCSRGHLHNLVSGGQLPRHGAKGTGLRFRRVDLDRYVEERR